MSLEIQERTAQETTSHPSEAPWWISFFQGEYLRIYSPFLTPEKTRNEVAGIIRLLNLPRGSSILDVGCANGRVALPLAQSGYDITGIDMNNDFLQQGRDEASDLDLSVRFMQADMRELPFIEAFDAAINTFSTFGYFLPEEENERVLQQVYQALKPGGLFLLDTLFQPKVVKTFSPEGVTTYADGLYVVEKRRLNYLTSRYEVQITLLLPDGQRTSLSQSLRIYTLTELVQMHARAGLEVCAYYGGLDGRELSTKSRLVMVSRKGTPSAASLPAQ